MRHIDHSSRRPLLWGLGIATGIAIPVLFTACQDPAGPPPTLEAGVVSFDYSGVVSGRFVADGRCYWSDGYPAADSSCAVALDLGDTIRVRAVRDPRTIRWVHVNVRFPESAACGTPEACGVAFDRISVGGKVERSYRVTGADIAVTSQTADRIQGTFGGLGELVDGSPEDTIRITNGVFDVPLQ